MLGPGFMVRGTGLGSRVVGTSGFRSWVSGSSPLLTLERSGFGFQGHWFGVQGLGFRVIDSGFRVWISGSLIRDSGFGFQGHWSRVQGSGFGF